MNLPNFRVRYCAEVLPIFALFVLMISPTFGQNAEKLATAKTRITNTSAVIKTLSTLPSDQSIPAELLAKAKVIAVFPNVTKLNLLFQKAMKGSGLAMRKNGEVWGTPVFYQFGMVDTGWTTVEAKSPSVVMLFMNDSDLKKDQVDISGTVAGPIGAIPEADKKKFENARVIAYGVTADKLLGIKIEGSSSTQSSMAVDNGMNKPIFGKKGNEVFWSDEPPANMLTEQKDLQTALVTLMKAN